jgi:hypothetical protein
VIRRTAVAAVIAAPLALAVPGAPAHAGVGDGVPNLLPGDVSMADGTLVEVGDTVGHLAATATGCVANAPVGALFVPTAGEMSVTLDIDGACNVIVSSIIYNVADTVDAGGLLTLSPGAGLPALPETTDDAIVDPGLVTDFDSTNLGGIITCKHQGWSKATLLYYDLRWVTATESRVQANWSSTGYRNECYGRSVSNMVVNTSSKYSYCYASKWENSGNNGCYYAVRKEAPSETAARVTGHDSTDSESYDLNARIYADTGSSFLAQCYITNGTVPSHTKLDCHARQEQ